MIKKVLQAKSWVIFMLIVGLPILLEWVFPPFPPTTMSRIIIPIISVLFGGGLLLWMYSIASGLQDNIPSSVKLNFKRFKVIFFLTILLLIIISFVMTLQLHSTTNLGFIELLILFVMFGIFYTLVFTARTFKTCELQRQVKFSDYAGEFMIFWFFPLGIFVIQPKVNKLIAN
jgi:hypothetical protein